MARPYIKYMHKLDKCEYTYIGRYYNKGEKND